MRVPVEDLDEMLGNLLDNACKWARSRVAVSAALDGARVVIDVDDDGPGLTGVDAGAGAAARRARRRGGARARASASPSSRDLAEPTAGPIALERSPHGGVRARLTLPAQS